MIAGVKFRKPLLSPSAARWRAAWALPALLALSGALAAVPSPARAQAQAQARSGPAFEDTMAQRTQACSACHGAQGRAGPDGYYPRIAGKPAGYLYNQLLHFRDGRRHYGLMTRLLDPLSDAYLLEIAQHFASLQLPYPAPAPVRAPAMCWIAAACWPCRAMRGARSRPAPAATGPR